MPLRVEDLPCVKYSSTNDPDGPRLGPLSLTTLLRILRGRAVTQCPTCSRLVYEQQLVEFDGKVICLGTTEGLGCMTPGQLLSLVCEKEEARLRE